MATATAATASIKLKKLHEITPAQKEQLAGIAGDIKVMQHVANGQPWGGEKVSKLVHQAKSDWKDATATATATTWMHWAIMLNDNDVIGYLAIFPEQQKEKEDKYFLRYFIRQDLQREGYGSQALRLALVLFRHLRPDARRIYASVHDTNLGGKAFLDKHGFIQLGPRKIGVINIKDYYKKISCI
jgi:RimJ/RimL family protein N-acetyltransferase